MVSTWVWGIGQLQRNSVSTLSLMSRDEATSNDPFSVLPWTFVKSNKEWAGAVFPLEGIYALE
jgi:hypothetical protein